MADLSDYEYWGMFAQLKELNIFDAPPGDLYGSEFADFYDRFVGSFTGDVPLFTRLLPANGRVLDLACGAGRIGIPLARSGYDVDGIDLSPDMLRLAATKAAEEQPEVQARLAFHEGDMTEFEQPHRYDLVVVGVTSISLLHDRSSRERMFACVAKHLKPLGRLVFDILDLREGRWQALDNFHETWAVETDDGTDFAIVGQRFFPDSRLFSLNLYREQVGWDNETKRYLGCSVKAWLDEEHLTEELANGGLRIVEHFEYGKQRYFVAALEAAFQ